MLSDPITIASQNLIFANGGPFTGATIVLDGLVLNKISQSGRESFYESPGSVTSALNMSALKLNIAHQSTNQGRVRSKFRVDAKMFDDLQREHSCSATLTVDRELVPTAEGIIVWSRALELFFKALIGLNGSDELETTGFSAEFLNGES